MKNSTTVSTTPKLLLFGSLSRTSHSVFELAAPALAALLYLGEFPSLSFIGLGLLTAFAGYTSVYALNDLVDYRVDRERILQGGFQDTDIAVESGLPRHPLAQGLLSYSSGLLWVAAWALIALIGAWMLNPVCALIFIIGAILEAVYCLMVKVSVLRTPVHGIVKTSGAIAGVFAVNSQPDFGFLILLFFWLYFWEIGGQNVPADWHDMQEDRMLEAKTVPLLYGPKFAGRLILFCLSVSVVLGCLLVVGSPAALPEWPALLVLAAGVYFLMVPALRLYRRQDRASAGGLFSRATFYVPVVCLIVIFSLVTGMTG